MENLSHATGKDCQRCAPSTTHLPRPMPPHPPAYRAHTRVHTYILQLCDCLCPPCAGYQQSRQHLRPRHCRGTGRRRHDADTAGAPAAAPGPTAAMCTANSPRFARGTYHHQARFWSCKLTPEPKFAGECAIAPDSGRQFLLVLTEARAVSLGR